MALTSLTQIKNFLGVTNSSRDVRLAALQAAAETEIIRYCGREFEYSANIVEYHSPNSLRDIHLRRPPVARVNNVWVDFDGNWGSTDDSFASDKLLVQGTDYALQLSPGSSLSANGLVRRLRGTWYEQREAYALGQLSRDVMPTGGAIKVDYDGGYTVIPQDLQYAVCWIVSWMMRNLEHAGQLWSEKIGDYSYTLARYPPEHPLLGSAQQILSKYREVPW